MQIPGYNIIRKINSGGMATVHLATQLSIGRTVALKIMKPELDQDPEFHKRFQREAIIIGQLSHPNIIPIYDIGRHNGLNYISMEYVANGTLDEKIAAGIHINEAIAILIAIASALGHAHKKGYVHRDIKPENILFRSDNTPVLTDFGIARTIKSSSSMTQIGSVVGTPYYMSPEQAKGEATDGRSDLYSLGILFYEMLTGHRPFQGENALALGIKHINERPPELPLSFLHYQLVLDKLIAKKPEQRFQDAHELILALHPLQYTAQSLQGKTGNLQLLKAIGRRTINDIGYYGAKYSTALAKYIVTLQRGKIDESELILSPAIADISNAATGISSQSVTPIHVDKSKKHRWMYGALVSLFAVIIFIGLLYHKNSLSDNNRQAAAKNEFRMSDRVSLTINVRPATARIRILNIKEKYSPDMYLPTGTYHIEISQYGYGTKTEWITLRDHQVLEYSLVKTQKNNNQPGLITPEMVLVTTSSFIMGDPSPNADKAIKKVFLDKNFYISKYEITFDEYDYFALATNRQLPDDKGWGRGNRPVINVNWADAKAYTHWLTQMTGDRYRLPTNIEWEFAARGNTTSLYWWGDNKDNANDKANCRFGCKPWLTIFFNNKTEPVGTYQANAFGLYDSAGNVAEWVEDCYEEITTNDNPCQYHLIRGGSFADSAEDIASHASAYLASDARQKHTGFRIVREKEHKKERDTGRNFFQRLFNR